MKTLINQIRAANDAGLYYIALQSELSIPDIAGALGEDDRRATGTRYAVWFETWVHPELLKNRNRKNSFTGEDCYRFRCSMLHQGSSYHPNSPFKRIMFIAPGYPNYQMHYVTIGADSSEPALLIQVDEFIEEILAGAENWLKLTEETELFKKNYFLSAKLNPAGLKPWINGVPVIG